jgi:hypothetical protein
VIATLAMSWLFSLEFAMLRLALGGAYAAPHILWLAGAPSDSHYGHLGAEAGHPLARCPLTPHL